MNAFFPVISRWLGRRGYAIVPQSILFDWQVERQRQYQIPATLPLGASGYLTTDNPRLQELLTRYKRADVLATGTDVWHPDHVSSTDLMFFRGDNAYLWQCRGKNMNEISYALTAYYVLRHDRLGLMSRLTEDDMFGAVTFRAAGLPAVSRDLLDSVGEISFLEEVLQISHRRGINILDIGAGYGRLAHRMCMAMPSMGRYFCTDAIAVSSFLSEYYLRCRGVAERAVTVMLDELDTLLADVHIDVAINIHSFSECREEAIRWWLGRIARAKIRYLMIVPNANPVNSGGARLVNKDGVAVGVLIQEAGYESVEKRPKYLDCVVQTHGVNPTYYYLFELHPSPRFRSESAAR